jgi:signal transduction histidine kinase
MQFLSVKDNGPGLSPEALTRATQAFYRAPGVRVAGSGLDLSVVEQIAKVSGGHLQLKHNLLQGLEVQRWLRLESPVMTSNWYDELQRSERRDR